MSRNRSCLLPFAACAEYSDQGCVGPMGRIPALHCSADLTLRLIKSTKIKKRQRLCMMKSPQVWIPRAQMDRHVEMGEAFLGTPGVPQCLSQTEMRLRKAGIELECRSDLVQSLIVLRP